MELAYRWDLKAKRKDNNPLKESDWIELEVEKERISSLMELMSNMKEEMSANRAAPKLLGLLELNEDCINGIIAAISTAVSGLIVCFFTGLMTELGEKSGIYPT